MTGQTQGKRRKLINVAFIAVTFAAFTMAGCGSDTPTPIEEKVAQTPDSNPIDAAVMPEPAPACDLERFESYDSIASVGDRQGHGPDIGSSEWKWVVSRKLGTAPPDKTGDSKSRQWCASVEKALNGVHAMGYRNIVIGEHIAQHREVVLEDWITEECRYGRLPGNDDLLFMVVYGELARIDVSETESLPNGLGVGSSADDVRAAYEDRLTIEPNKYDENASDYVVSGIGEKGVLFEVSDERVTRFRVGRLPELNWVEGCL